MDGHRTDGKILLLLHTLNMRGSHVASLVKFCPMVYRISSVIRRGFPFQYNLKDLDPSCWVLIFEIVLEKKIPIL